MQTPIYYYEMWRPEKHFDRLNPLYSTDYSFRDIYMIATAALRMMKVHLKKLQWSARLGRLF